MLRHLEVTFTTMGEPFTVVLGILSICIMCLFHLAFLFSPCIQLVLSILVFNVWPPKWEKEKKGRKRGSFGFLSPLGVTSARGRYSNCSCWPLCTSKTKAAICNHSTDPQYLEDRVFFAHPDSCKLCTQHPRNTCKTVCHGAGVGGRWPVYCAKSWFWPKLTSVYWSKPSPGNCKPSVDSRVPK